MRKSISVTFFSMVATLLVLGTAVLGCSEWLLFSRYFAQERYDTLDSVADVTQRAADYIVQQAALPKGAELDAMKRAGYSLPPTPRWWEQMLWGRSL